jgi:hypothetical protein
VRLIPWTTRRELKADIAALEAQLERSEKIDTAVKLIKAGEQPDKSFLLELHSELWPLIAHTLHVWFKDSGGINYVEQTVDFPGADETKRRKASMTFNVHPGDGGFEVYTLTLQRVFGQTPHQMAAAAKASETAMHDRVAKLQVEADRLRRLLAEAKS